MNPISPHLDLAELLAEVNGEQDGDQAREHLATCESCSAEARRWGIVADGVRGLTTDAPDLAGRPWRTGRADPRRRRTMLAASAAAAVVVLGGAGYGLTAAFGGHTPSPAGGTSTAALTRVNGCAILKQVTGTLTQVNGTALLIQTPSGQLVTVTTTASTRMVLASAPLSDITDGSYVSVTGPTSDGTVLARMVKLGELPNGQNSSKQQSTSPQQSTPPPGGTMVPMVPPLLGTVADATSTGFIVDTSAGTQVRVTTSSGTVVMVRNASLTELRTDADTTAFGYSQPNGTLSAIAVAQSPNAAQLTFQVNGCSPASVEKAITTALVSRG